MFLFFPPGGVEQLHFWERGLPCPAPALPPVQPPNTVWLVWPQHQPLQVCAETKHTSSEMWTLTNLRCFILTFWCLQNHTAHCLSICIWIRTTCDLISTLNRMLSACYGQFIVSASTCSPFFVPTWTVCITIMPTEHAAISCSTPQSKTLWSSQPQPLHHSEVSQIFNTH